MRRPFRPGLALLAALFLGGIFLRADNDGRIATLAVSDLREYEAQPPAVQRLLARGLMLTTRDLSYQYGSSDPEEGGMDCSGTVYYLLKDAGLTDVPRDSSEMYQWVVDAGLFHPVTSYDPRTPELDGLRPGDLLFWTGTYRVTHASPVSHVMIYLGINRNTGRRVMVGASEGRRFNDISRYGVSVFDFTIPHPDLPAGDASAKPSELHSRFIGYGRVPGLEKGEDDAKP